MAKNKGTHGKSKASEIEETDEFISTAGRVMQALAPHKGKLAVAAVLAALCFIGVVTWQWYEDRNDQRATAAYHDALSVSRAAIVAEDAEPPNLEAGEPPTFTSHEARSQATLEALDKLDSGSTPPGIWAEATLLRAATLLDLGKYDDAAALYEKYAESGGTPSQRTRAIEGAGYALEAKAAATEDAAARKQALEQALAAFERMAPTESQPEHDVALYHQARILSVLDRKADAVRLYKDVLAVTDTDLKLEVEARLTELGASE